ncbi:MAG TPA: beta-N-acetylhexosaminidase [Bryobacteraceae bacterium]|nr:beta-N-acetylhexosaminidase [Bryobacteraceae bacterium]
MRRIAFALLACVASLAAAPLVTPAPRRVEWTGARFQFEDPVRIDARRPEAKPAADRLAEGLRRLGRRSVVPGKSRVGGIRLIIDPKETRPEAYRLETAEAETVISAGTARGLLYGVETLLQLIEPGGRVLGARIEDWPELSFRGVHICIFPGTDLRHVERAIRMAARYKYNAIVLEPWASIASRSHPYMAYEHAYTAAEIRPLVELARRLQMDVFPLLNSWGHASGMRQRSGEHAVLDRFPDKAALFEPGGWSFCLSNPAIYPNLFDRAAELMELFGPSPYFHAGMDEAWGYAGHDACPRCAKRVPHELIASHIEKLHKHLTAKGRQVFMWHDMFIRPDDPELGRVSPANSRPPVNSHLALASVPKDVIINAWNYDTKGSWPVPKYFHDRGYRVVVSPWKARPNAIMMINTAKTLGLMGVLETTWDSLDVCLPSIGEAGVLAWTAPGYDLKAVPFDHWLAVIRTLP